MTLEGKITQILTLEEGTSAKGFWKKQSFIVNSEGEYANNVCFSIWGTKIEEIQLSLNTEVEVYFNLSSREYNNKWYTEAKVWKVTQKIVGDEGAKKTKVNLPKIEEDEFEGDLPF